MDDGREKVAQALQGGLKRKLQDNARMLQANPDAISAWNPWRYFFQEVGRRMDLNAEQKPDWFNPSPPPPYPREIADPRNEALPSVDVPVLPPKNPSRAMGGLANLGLDALTPDYLRERPLPDMAGAPGKIPTVDPSTPEIAAFGGIDLASMIPSGGAAKLAPMSLAIFAGPAAKTADRGALKLAEEMTAKGFPKEQIWDATGWFKGAEGKWRFEIPDDKARMSGMRDVPLPNAMSHPDLYAAYPDLRRVQMSSRVPDNAAGVQWSPDEIGIHPFAGGTPQVPLHEVQHWIQEAEGFAPGGNPGDMMRFAKQAGVGSDRVGAVAKEAYRRLAGEVEARNVEQRMTMSPEVQLRVGPEGYIIKEQSVRRQIAPWLTQDVPDELQIVRGLPGLGHSRKPGKLSGLTGNRTK